MYYNFTMHNQSQLAAIMDEEVEVAPRLKPVEDVKNYETLKANIRDAVKGVPLNAKVIIGGLGQYQALLMQLSFQFYFVDMKDRVPVGLIEHEPFDRFDLFEIENG